MTVQKKKNHKIYNVLIILYLKTGKAKDIKLKKDNKKERI